MLRGVTGDSVFFRILKTYYEKFKYSSADTEDFIKVCNDVSSTDLRYFFDQWVIKGKGRPDYKYSWFADSSDNELYILKLNLKQTQDDFDVYKMPVSISLVTENGTEKFDFINDKREQTFEFTLNTKPIDVIIDPDKKILKKIQKEDYYNSKD